MTSKEDAALQAYGAKIDAAERALRPDAAQALRDVEDAVRAGKNLESAYGVDPLRAAALILDESRIWRHEHGFRRSKPE